MHNSLTAGSLRGPGKLAIPPMVFAKHDESEAIGESKAVGYLARTNTLKRWFTSEGLFAATMALSMVV